MKIFTFTTTTKEGEKLYIPAHETRQGLFKKRRVILYNGISSDKQEALEFANNDSNNQAYF